MKYDSEEELELEFKKSPGFCPFSIVFVLLSSFMLCEFEYEILEIGFCLY
ncbi:hypothetical protein RchiOBHm_Chr4g0415721 [Rosa chinensis]|uniref:Uncharacterized protein n=1 Tax=Rosa chinensis TaxID=74649 RepID=A0A2P6QWR7_ROSCH|nr:hypothetical protein RchiOBHm_Chr4g0415721 [Rosa chinensis]